MGSVAVQELFPPHGSVRDAPCRRTTSPSSAARTPTARPTAGGAGTTSWSSTASARLDTGCSTAGPARPGSPSSRGRRSSTPGCRTRRSWPSWSTWPMAAASARPPGWSGSTRTPSRGWPCWPAGTPRAPTTSSWPFPPGTREVQFDEKWAFVAKKQRHCDPADPDDDHRGDYWDYVALDPEHRLVLAVVPGARTEENARAIVAEVEKRLGGEPPGLMTSDEYPVYEKAIRETVGEPGRQEGKDGADRGTAE